MTRARRTATEPSEKGEPIATRTRNRTASSSKRKAREEAAPRQESAKKARGRKAPAPRDSAAREEPQDIAGPAAAQASDEGGPSRVAEAGHDKANKNLQGRMSRSSEEGGNEAPGDTADHMDEEARMQEMLGSMGAAGNALQGLLRKLGGSGFEGGIPGAGGLSHSRFKSILVALREEDDDSAQLSALGELCEMLSISTEESLSVFPVEQMIPVLVNLLNAEHNPDMMLLAARAITFLADVMPATASSIVRHGAVTVLCGRLLAIEYIDLAEQSLQALEKLSHEHPQAVLQEGGLMAVLSFLDFFQTGVQRVAVATAAAMCRNLTSDSVETVTSAVPILTDILQYEDARVVDHACTALTRIAESYARYPDRLDMLCNSGLINNAVQLAAVSESGSMQAQLSTSTYFGLLKLLGTCAAGSAAVAETLLGSALPTTIRRLLRTSTLFSSSTTSNASVLRSNDQLLVVVSLVAKILPPVPADAAQPDGAPDSTAPASAPPPAADQRAQFLEQNVSLLEKFSSDLLPSLLHVYASTMQQEVRAQVLSSISRTIYFNSPDVLSMLLEDLEVSSFVAGLLGSSEQSTVVSALQLAALLMDKLPAVFGPHFLKEGVVHAIDKLAASMPEEEEKAEKKPQPVPATAASRFRSSGSTGERSSRRVTRSRAKSGSQDMETKGAANEEEAELQAAKEALAAAEAAACAAMEVAARVDPEKKERRHIAAQARAFKAQHFSGTGAAGTETEGMRTLRELCSRLSKEGAVAALLAAMQSDANISSFEFLTSGTVHQLKDYLLGKELNGPKRQRKHLARIQAFAEVALGNGSLGGGAPMRALVRKLQAALASAEDLPVPAPARAPASYRYSHVYGSGGQRRADPGSLQSGLAALAQPFKLRLCKVNSGGPHLRDYSGNVVLIEPLATIGAIEDFLWPRVYRSSAEIAAEETAAARRAQVAKDAAEAGKRAASSEQPSSRAAPGADDESGKPPPRRMTRSASSKAQAIPEPPARPAGSSDSGAAAAAPTTAERRMTRAAARAAAEAGELPMEEPADAAHPMDADGNAASPRGTSDGNGSTEHEDDVMLQNGDEDDDDEDAYDEEDLVDDDILDGGSEDSDDAARMGIERMQVHEMELGADGDVGSDGGGAETAQPQPPAITAANAAAVRSARRAGAASPPAREASRSGAAGAASYAQAAMTGTQAAAEAARAAGQPPPPDQPKLSFSIGSQRLSSSMTIFQAVQLARQHAASTDAVSSDPLLAQRALRSMWDEIHSLDYGMYDAVAANAEQQDTASRPAPTAKTEHSLHQGGEAARSALADLLKVPDLSALGISSTTADLLTVLTLLESINRSGLHLAAYQRGTSAGSDAAPEGAMLPPGRVPRSEFTSNKLAPKLAQQLKDVLAICGGTLPAWTERLVFGSRFLFPFALRRAWFLATALGMPRALSHLQAMAAAEGGGSQDADRDDRTARISRMTRQKVRVSRKRILESAAKVMEMYAGSRALLELEFFGEVGTGLGPTLEFYTLLAHELQRKSLGMWRCDSGGTGGTTAAGAEKLSDDIAHIRADRSPLPMQSELVEGGKASSFVAAPQGLFPSPLPPTRSGSRLLGRFTLLGRAAAKALQDGRMLDVPLSYTFYRIAAGRPVDLFDVRRVDSGLGATLEKLAAACGSSNGRGRSSSPLIVDGCPIEDLCLSFVLPGFPEYELRPGGTDITVDSSNCAAYVAAVVNATLGAGVARQVAAFRAGFEDVFPLRHLDAFYEDEVEAMLCGTGEKWNVEMLGNSIKFDHGYGRDSAAIGHFLRVLQELDAPDQRRFLRFVTGSPRLPPGGVAALQPRLTVVRKHSAASMGLADGSLGSSLGASLGTTPAGAAAATAADGDLPSVMTCANYIKLPPYSSYEVTKERVLYAIREGQGSFDLS